MPEDSSSHGSTVFFFSEKPHTSSFDANKAGIIAGSVIGGIAFVVFVLKLVFYCHDSVSKKRAESCK